MDETQYLRGLGTINIVVQIRLLGKVEITIKDAPPLLFRGKSGLWLLGILTLQANRSVERDWLAGTLWPDSAPEQGRANLRRALTDVRRALGDAASRLTNPSQQTVSLQLAENEADVLAFRAGALASYGGELMPGCPLEWVETERRALEEIYLTMGEQQAATLAPEAALVLLESLRACAPLRESLLRLQLTVLCRLGNRAEAQQAYYRFRRVLLEQRLGEPSVQTQDHWKSLQSLKSSAETSPSPDNPASVSVTLPTPVTSCLGRERELDTLVRLLKNHRLITVTGLGGIGKTRLVIEAARRYERVLFLELADWQDSKPLAETLEVVLQSQEGPVLLVLDNFEQLVGAEANRVLRAQLEKHAQLRCLVTSRRALGFTGEQIFPLEPLDLPQHPGSPERLKDFASIRLLVERARAVRPSFELTPENADCIVALCQQAEGIPLALELLAAHFRILSPEALLAQVKQTRLPLLARQGASETPRQQSLWRIIESTVSLLTEAHRTGFWQLSVFRGGWSIEAAQAVCGTPIDSLFVISLLESLTDNSLIRFANGRYSQLETLRDFGLATQPDAIRTQALRDHAAFFLALAEKYGATPKDFALLDTEQDNLRATFETFFAEDDIPSALRWTRALRFYWFHRRGGQVFSERLLDRLGDRPDVRAERAELQESLGAMYAMNGAYDAAQQHLQTALRYFRETGEQVLQAKVLSNLAGMAIERGEMEQARVTLEEALVFWRTLNQPRGLGIALANLSIVLMNQGELDAAELLVNEALEIRTAQGDSYGIATCQVNRGAIALLRGANSLAEAAYRDALNRYQEIGDRRGEANCLEGIIEVFLNQNKPAEALRYWREVVWLIQEYQLPETALQVKLHRRIDETLGNAASSNASDTHPLFEKSNIV